MQLKFASITKQWSFFRVSSKLPQRVLMPLMEVSTLDLEEIQLLINLNLIQQPVSSTSPSFFFLPFDFSTSQDSPFTPLLPNPIVNNTKNQTQKSSNPHPHHPFPRYQLQINPLPNTSTLSHKPQKSDLFPNP